MLSLFCFCQTWRTSCWLFPRCSGDGGRARQVRTGSPAHLDAHMGRQKDAQPESPDLIQYLDLSYVFYSKPNVAFLIKTAIPKAFLPGSQMPLEN